MELLWLGSEIRRETPLIRPFLCANGGFEPQGCSACTSEAGCRESVYSDRDLPARGWTEYIQPLS